MFHSKRNCILSLIAILIFQAITLSASTEDDLKDLENLKRYVGSNLSTAISEVIEASKKVKTYDPTVSTSGYAKVLYDSDNKPAGYHVCYQGTATATEIRLGNLAHELMHVAVNEAFKRDFVNYTNKGDKESSIEKPEYAKDSKSGYFFLKNEEARQNSRLNKKVVDKVIDLSESLKKLADKSKLAPDRIKDVKAKLDYMAMWPHKEVDTCLIQIMIWCQHWKINTGDAFYKGVDAALKAANSRRKSRKAF